MGDTRDPETDQPLPIANDSTPIVDLVVADLLSRKEHGIRKYGQALQAHNGRNALQDLYEEHVDAILYLRQALEENDRYVKLGQSLDAAVRAFFSDRTREPLRGLIEVLYHDAGVEMPS